MPQEASLPPDKHRLDKTRRCVTSMSCPLIGWLGAVGWYRGDGEPTHQHRSMNEDVIAKKRTMLSNLELIQAPTAMESSGNSKREP
jgi:hypothetical protein